MLITTSSNLHAVIEEIINQRHDAGMIEVLSEPEGKNTAPAVGLALSKYYSLKPDSIMGIFPADHHIINNESFISSISHAIQAAERDHIVTIGISPQRPETGYGYIEKTRWEIGEIPGVYEVSSFFEKPDLKTAESYVASGEFMWNSGIYVSKVKVLLDEFSQHLPDVYQNIIAGYDQYIQSYETLPDISLDYGIAEKSKRMAVVPANFGWCDLGSWNALAELFPQDQMMNICTGNDVIVIESSNCLVKQTEKTIVLFGLQDVLVVETDDIIMVCDRHKSQDVKQVVDSLTKLNRDDLL